MLRIVLLLLRQFLLPPRQIRQLLHGFVDLLLLLFGRRCAGVGLILVLFFIQFQIEEVGEIASGAAATTAASATAADLNLNVAEGRFSAQQMLQSLLLGRQSVLERQAFQLVRSGLIAATAASISFTNC